MNKKMLEEIVKDFKEGLHAGRFEKLMYLNPLVFGIASSYCHIKQREFYAGLFGIATIGTGLLTLIHCYCMGKIKKEVEKGSGV